LGEFRIAGLPPGEYYIAAVPNPISPFGPSTRSTSSAITTATTFYPGTTDQGSAAAISLTAGGVRTDVVFAMLTVPAFHVSGVVVDQNDKPVAGAMMNLMADPRTGAFLGPVASGARSGDDGTFTINNVPAGSYRLTAFVPNVISGTGTGGGFTSWSVGGVSGGTISGGVSGGVVGGVTTGIVGGGNRPTEVIISGSDVDGLRIITQR
jgi:hypothetical protein